MGEQLVELYGIDECTNCLGNTNPPSQRHSTRVGMEPGTPSPPQLDVGRGVAVNCSITSPL